MQGTNTVRRDAEFSNSDSHEEEGERRIFRGGTADSQIRGGLIHRRGDTVERSQYCRMKCAVDISHPVVCPIGGQQVHHQVVGADGEEVNFPLQFINQLDDLGKFDHDTEPRVLIMGDAVPLKGGQTLLHLGLRMFHLIEG